MSRNWVRGVGQAGIVKDTAPAVLQSGFWSDGRNVRFESNKIKGMNGAVVGLEGLTGLLSVGLISSPTDPYIVFTTGGKIKQWDLLTVTDITRATGGDYSETADTLFDYLPYNGFLILNNGVEVPQVWVPSTPTSPCIPLANWDVTWTCSKLRSFGPILMALDITENTNLYPHKIRWSSPAVPGAVPSTWDETDATQLAGEFTFADTNAGSLVDGLVLNNTFFVYKEGSIWALSLTNTQSVFSNDLLVDGVGLKNPRSLVAIPTSKDGMPLHFFEGDNTFYINDGTQVVPVFEEVFKDEILTLRDPTYYQRSYSVVNQRKSELWYCIPEKGSSTCTLAFVWNYRNNTFSIKELGGSLSIGAGLGLGLDVVISEEQISFSDGAYFSDGSGFFYQEYTPGAAVVVEATEDGKIYYLEQGNKTYDGTALVRYIERESMACVRTNKDKTEWVDYQQRKLISSIVMKLYTGTVVFQIGTQEVEGEAINWSPKYNIDKGYYRFDLPEPVSGRLISFRVSSNGEDDFSISALDYEVSLLGEF